MFTGLAIVGANAFLELSILVASTLAGFRPPNVTIAKVRNGTDNQLFHPFIITKYKDFISGIFESLANDMNVETL
jgi:hypothetical protein